MPKIIIIDDEKDMLELLEYHLKLAGYETKCFLSSAGVEAELSLGGTSLLLVDRNLISEDGLDLVKKLRAKGHEVAVIFVSAKGANSDKIAGFDSGCDDYIAKPFDINELKARIKAVLRRTAADKDELSFGEIYMDLAQNEVRVGGEILELTALEFHILSYFLAHSKLLISRYELASQIWGDDEVSDKAINIAISRLKRKLGGSGEHLKAIRGEGYKLC